MKALLFPIIIILVFGMMSCSEKTTEPFANTVATPTYSIEPGVYLPQQTVTINCSTPDATIRYTTNGTVPNKRSTVYTAPIEIDSVLTIKAMAFKKDWNQSSVITGAYEIFQGNPELFANITNVMTTPDSLYADGGITASVIKVIVKNGSNLPVAGQVVSFQTTMGVIFPQGTTNAAGEATATLRADHTTGLAHVTAMIRVYHPDNPELLVLTDTLSVNVRIIPIPVASPEVHSIVFIPSGQIGLQVINTGNYDSALLRVRLLDESGNPVIVTQNVWFKIVNPTVPLGANINNLPQTDSVLAVSDNGYAQVNLYSGTMPGMLNIRASVTTGNGYIASYKADIFINAGPAHQVDIFAGGFDTGVNMGSGLWNIVVSAQLQDIYGNPCGYGTSVWFSLPDNPFNCQINSVAYVGNESTAGDSTAGVAYTTLTYSGGYSFESLKIKATTIGANSTDLFTVTDIVLPLNQPQLELEVVPGNIVFHGNDNPVPVSATAIVTASVFDAQGCPIHNVRINLTSSRGVFEAVHGTNRDPLNCNPYNMPNVIVTDWHDPVVIYDHYYDPLWGLTGGPDYDEGQSGLAQGMIRFYVWEVPLGDPMTGTPGISPTTITGTILGTNTSNSTTVSLIRYPN